MYLSVSSIAPRVVLPPGKRTRLSFSLPYHHSLGKGCLGNVNPVFIEQSQELQGSLRRGKEQEVRQRIWTQCWQQLLCRGRQSPRWSQTGGPLLLFLWILGLVAPWCCQGATKGTELEPGSGWLPWGLGKVQLAEPGQAGCQLRVGPVQGQSEVWILEGWYSKTGEL